MEFIKTLLAFGDTQGPVPAVFGIYHIICLVLTAGLTAFAAIRGKHHSEKKIVNVVLITAIVVALFEIYKQINYTFGNGSGDPYYQWYAFPWQFCSTPLYIGLRQASSARAAFTTPSAHIWPLIPYLPAWPS